MHDQAQNIAAEMKGNWERVSSWFGTKKVPLVPTALFDTAEVPDADNMGQMGFDELPRMSGAFHYLAGSLDSEEEKIRSVAEAWPICARTGKPMLYLGWVSLTPWAELFASLEPWYPYEKASHALSPFSRHVPYEVEGWPIFYLGQMAHVWISNEASSWNFGLRPSATMRIVNVFPGDKDESDPSGIYQRVWESKQEEAIKARKEPFAPKGFLTAGKYTFQPDPVTGYLSDKVRERVHRASVEGYQFFGQPQSQQEPHRYLNPKPYPCVRGLTPFLSWHDQSHDFDYQIYFDTMAENYEGIDGYVDASCT
jgi:hypothetical protein